MQVIKHVKTEQAMKHVKTEQAIKHENRHKTSKMQNPGERENQKRKLESRIPSRVATVLMMKSHGLRCRIGPTRAQKSEPRIIGEENRRIRQNGVAT